MLSLIKHAVCQTRLCANVITTGSIKCQLQALAARRLCSTDVAKVDEQQKEPVKKQAAFNPNNPPGLMQFFDDPKNWGEQEVKSGRAWKKEELRIKSNEDLHKLWFVLLKERNMLLTMAEAATKQTELFPSPERIDRVEESMRNLEDVVRERNKAYWELEVGEGETGERRAVFRRDMFGRHRL